MPWFKVDDTFGDHPKTLELLDMRGGRDAVALWVLAGSWASKVLSSGRVPASIVHRYGPKRTPLRAADLLVSVGLWERDGDGFVFHDWPEYQPSKESVERDRALARERMRRLRDKRKEAEIAKLFAERSSEHDPNVRANFERSSHAPSPVPSPVPCPDPISSSVDPGAPAPDPGPKKRRSRKTTPASRTEPPDVAAVLDAIVKARQELGVNGARRDVPAPTKTVQLVQARLRDVGPDRVARVVRRKAESCRRKPSFVDRDGVERRAVDYLKAETILAPKHFAWLDEADDLDPNGPSAAKFRGAGDDLEIDTGHGWRSATPEERAQHEGSDAA